ncbi:hypothetical protein D3C75_643240 [compost metagenome]
MIKHEDIISFYNYKDSFAKFALDFFGLETNQDMDSRELSLRDPEELVVAHIVWKTLFNQCQTFMVACANSKVADYWQRRVLDALSQLPEYMKTELRVKRGEIDTGTACRVLFQRVHENTGRGMTLSGLYVIEPHMLGERVHHEFMCSILPTMLSGKQNRQIIQYSRYF